MLGIGIDFGTSNSVAGWFDGSDVHLVEVEPGLTAVPTAIHLDKFFQALTGTDAIEAYVKENTNRRVEMVAKPVGIAAFDVKQVFESEERNVVYGAVDDYGLPGRLFLGIKRLLGEEGRIAVFERQYRLVALITPILVSIRRAFDRIWSVPHNQVCVGRPVDFEGRRDNKNMLAENRLRESCAHANIDNVIFCPEPIAASLSFIHKQKIKSDSTILTIDFGGGTLDLSLIQFQNQNFRVLGTKGASLGGDLIDQLIYRELIFPQLGAGVEWSRLVDGQRIATPFPFTQYEQGLLNWSITHTLNQNKYIAPIHQYIVDGGTETEKLQRLRDVIQCNGSYQIIQAIKDAKAELSEAEATTIDIPEFDICLAFSRQQLADIIAGVMFQLDDCIHSLLKQTDIEMRDVDYVVRTGGSSKLVAVENLLEQYFPGKVVEHDTFTSVASGLAIASYYGFKP